MSTCVMTWVRLCKCGAYSGHVLSCPCPLSSGTGGVSSCTSQPQGMIGSGQMPRLSRNSSSCRGPATSCLSHATWVLHVLALWSSEAGCVSWFDGRVCGSVVCTADTYCPCPLSSGSGGVSRPVHNTGHGENVLRYWTISYRGWEYRGVLPGVTGKSTEGVLLLSSCLMVFVNMIHSAHPYDRCHVGCIMFSSWP